MASNQPSSSSDPLASVITQVQPGQAAPGASLRAGGAGPARPTRVAKPGTAKAAAQQHEAAEKRKKKKRAQAQQQQQRGSSEVPAAATAVAGSSSTDSQLPTSSTRDTTTQEATEAEAPLNESSAHSNDPSSTLIGTTSTVPDISPAKPSTIEVGGTPGAAGVGETDVAAKLQSAPISGSQDLTKAAENLQPQQATRKATKTSASATTGHRTEPTSSTLKGSSVSPAKQAMSTSTAPSKSAQRKKKSPLKKIIAFLTCSSGIHDADDDARPNRSQASRRDQPKDEVEMTTRKATGTSAGAGSQPALSPSKAAKPSSTPSKKAGKLAPPIAGAAAGGAIAGSKLRSGRASSRPSSARNSLEGRSESGVVAPAPGTPTPGGGTMLPREETGDVMSGAVVPPGSSFVSPHDRAAAGTPTSSKHRGGDGDHSDAGDANRAAESATGEDDDEEDEDDDEDDESGGELVEDYLDDEEASEEQRLIAQGGIGIPKDAFGNDCPLLQPLSKQDSGRKCLVLDLDETLVHSSFKMIANADFTVPVEIDGTVHNVYVIKRPGVDEFMRQMGEIYEVVVFTASLSKYADPVLDILDIHRVVRHRLFRESCYNHRGNYVKDLSQLGRPIAESIIIDNSPASYIFHPNNAVPISSWFNDPHDTELTDLCPFLADLSDVGDVRAVLDGSLA